MKFFPALEQELKSTLHEINGGITALPCRSFVRLAAVFLVMAVTSCAPETKGPEKVIRDYESAHNTHDIEKMLSCMAEDVVFQAGSMVTGSGRERLRQLAEWDAAVNSKMTFDILEVSGDSVICMVIETNDWYSGLGIKNIVHEGSVFIVNDGKIQKVISSPSQAMRNRLMATLNTLSQWCKQQNDPTFDHLMSANEFSYTAESAAQWMALLKRWREATGQADIE